MRGLPVRCQMLPTDHVYNGDRVIGFDVVDHGADGGPMHVRVDVLSCNGAERISHETCVTGGMDHLSSSDETETVVVELRRHA